MGSSSSKWPSLCICLDLYIYFMFGVMERESYQNALVPFSIGRLEIDESLVGLGERVFCFILASFFQVP